MFTKFIKFLSLSIILGTIFYVDILLFALIPNNLLSLFPSLILVSLFNLSLYFIYKEV